MQVCRKRKLETGGNMGKELNFYGLATWLSEKFNMTDNEIVETFEEALKKVLEEEQNSLKKQ